MYNLYDETVVVVADKNIFGKFFSSFLPKLFGSEQAVFFPPCSNQQTQLS